MAATRRYPALSAIELSCRPLTFVCVHFSDDYFHNLAKSECVCDPANEVIVVDNRNNADFTTLSSAINAGIRQATHAVVVVVHEDVVLPDNWQQHFELALRELEASDPNWGIVGVGGWSQDGRFDGHLSDPRSYRDTLGPVKFRTIGSLDDQLLGLKNDGLLLDADLPSIHNIGRDLIATLSQRNRAAYVVNAPTIHKYADETGKIIATADDSPKIKDRTRLAYKAEAACCDEYIAHKWGLVAVEAQPLDISPEQETILDRPVMLIARGGGGSRLLHTIALDMGLFAGTKINVSGDAMEMVMPVYKGVIRKYSCPAAWQKDAIAGDLRLGAAAMLHNAGWPALWGFKLPETVYLLPEIIAAFPHARFLHALRDPLSTCLKREHITGRVDNQIGRAVIPPGYDHVGRPRAHIHDDAGAMRMAVTTVHQLDLALTHLPGDRTCVVRFETMLAEPNQVIAEVARWLGKDATGCRLAATVDPARAENPVQKYPAEVEAEVQDFLLPLRRKLGYVTDERSRYAGLVGRFNAMLGRKTARE
jgi:hypothetical protein